MLKREISLKVIGEKVKTVFFAIIYMTLNGHTCKLLKNIPNIVQTKGNGEINTS